MSAALGNGAGTCSRPSSLAASTSKAYSACRGVQISPSAGVAGTVMPGVGEPECVSAGGEPFAAFAAWGVGCCIAGECVVEKKKEKKRRWQVYQSNQTGGVGCVV